MFLRVSLFALVLLALGGGVRAAVAAPEPAEVPLEAPAAPDAPSETEESEMDKDAVPTEGTAFSEVIVVWRHGGEDTASSAGRGPRTPPPRR